MSCWMMFSSHTNQIATDWWSISAISSGCAKQVKLEKNQCEGTQKTINNRSNEWLTPSLCLFVCFASFIHSIIGKQNQNWKQRQTKIKWEQFLLLFLLLPSPTFHFFCILGASTIIDTIVQMWSRGALERTLPPTSTIYASPRPARLHCEQIWLRFSQQRRRFGTWGLVGGTWDLGKKEGLDLPALCSDLSTIPQLGEQWQGGGKSWGWGRDQIGCLILVPISEVWTMSRTTSSFQWQPITLSFCPFDWQFTFWTRTRTGVLKSVLKSAYIRLTEITVFIGSSSRGSVAGGRKAEKASECSVAGFSSSTNELRPWWTFDALFSRRTIAFDVDVNCFCSNIWFPRHKILLMSQILSRLHSCLLRNTSSSERFCPAPL